METFAPTLVFDALVEACNTERRSRLTFPVAGGGILVRATSSKGRLPLGFPADSVFEGTFAGAFFVVCLPFFVALPFAAGPFSSLEPVVKLQLELELDGVAAFRFSAFAVCFFIAAFASLASSFSYLTNSSIVSISFPLCLTAGEGALDTLEILPRPVLICITSGVGVPHGCASRSTFWFTSNIPNGSIVSLGVA